MLSARELVSHLLLYLLLILSYHPSHPILDYFISVLITALRLFLKLYMYHANYNHFLNSVRCFFAKLNWTKAAIERSKNELKYYGIDKTRLSQSSLKSPTSSY